MEKYFNRKYRLESSENFDEFMKAVGVGIVVRKIALSLSPIVELYKQGDFYVLTSSSAFKNHVTKFKPGVEMDDVTHDGRKIRTKFTIKKNVLYEEQVDVNNKKSSIERVFTEMNIKMILKVDNIICTRIYAYMK